MSRIEREKQIIKNPKEKSTCIGIFLYICDKI